MITAPLAFAPPHCPNRNCRFHNPIASGWLYKKAGFFTRQQPPHRIQRYQCYACHRYFSTQTFHISYWLKRADVVTTLLTKTVGCMANRQIARDIGVAPKPATVVVDGFETFELSQYWPFHFNVCVEKDTDFVLGFTDSKLRRKGRMTPEQKLRRQQLEHRYGRPDPSAVRTQMEMLLRDVAQGATRMTVQ